MYAAITLLKFRPGKAQDAGELFGNLVMPAYAEHVCRGAWIFTHPENDSAIVIVLYDSAEAIEAGGEKQAVEQLMKTFGDMLAEEPRRDVYNVLLGATSGPPIPQLAPLGPDILSLLSEISREL